MRTGKFIIGILLLCCFIRMVIGEPCTVPSGAWSRRCFAEIGFGLTSWLMVDDSPLVGRISRCWMSLLGYALCVLLMKRIIGSIVVCRVTANLNRGYCGVQQPGRSAIVVGQANYPGGKKGEPLRIDRRTLLLYRSLILRDGGKVMEKDGKIYIDGKSSSQYIPKQRFYYMEGITGWTRMIAGRLVLFRKRQSLESSILFFSLSIPKAMVESNSFATNDDAVSLRFKRSSCRYGWLNHNPARTAARIYINIYNFQ